MKVLLYSEMLEKINKSGLGRAVYHQKKALEKVGVECTFDKKERFDLLHINTYFHRSYFLAKDCQKAGIPIVYHAHSTMDDFQNSFKGSNLIAPLFKFWIKTCYELGDVIITPTNYSKKILQSYGLTQNIYAISNGIDLPSFKEVPNAREYFCKHFGFDNKDFIVMGVGLFIERKGILDFINLAKELPNMKFIWFGETNLKIIPKHVSLAIQNAPKNLIFPGFVPNEEIKLSLQACDVFLMPTFEETEGIPVLEASASRTPMIIRDIPVFDGWLENKRDVYKAKDFNDFKRLLCLMQEGKLADLTRSAYKLAQERDLSIIGKKLKNVYKTALRRRQVVSKTPSFFKKVSKNLKY